MSTAGVESPRTTPQPRPQPFAAAQQTPARPAQSKQASTDNRYDPIELPGEKQEHGPFAGVRFVYNSAPAQLVSVPGTAYITNYKLVFRSDALQQPQETPDAQEQPVSWAIPLHAIAAIEKVRNHDKQKEHASCAKVAINAKDMRRVVLLCADRSQRRAFVDHLRAAAFVHPDRDKLFAFSNRESFATNGYAVYSPVAEFSRLGVPPPPTTTSTTTSKGEGAAPAAWRWTTLNEDYSLCSTYPRMLVVPAAADDALVRAEAAFRTRQRLPVLTWLSRDGVPLVRSSQPRCGLSNTPSPTDIEYLAKVRGSNAAAPEQPLLFISDSRPKANALANRALGGGYEDCAQYSGCRLDFEDIPNIHGVRESYERVKALCQPGADDAGWLAQLDGTRWLDMCRLILLSVCKAVDFVDRQKQAVLFHCSDGWDRTSQCCALAELCLDPYYRTLTGFAVLLEKDWISFGHRFELRYGPGDAKPTDQRAPIFPQFVFCVYQLLAQFPAAFEFNSALLDCVLEHLYSCRFGTFLFDTERERDAAALRTKTVSLWAFVEAHRADFTSSAYDPAYTDVLYPDPSPRALRFWDDHYLAWQRSLEPATPVARSRAVSRQHARRQEQQLKAARAAQATTATTRKATRAATISAGSTKSSTATTTTRSSSTTTTTKEEEGEEGHHKHHKRSKRSNTSSSKKATTAAEDAAHQHKL